LAAFFEFVLTIGIFFLAMPIKYATLLVSYGVMALSERGRQFVGGSRQEIRTRSNLLIPQQHVLQFPINFQFWNFPRVDCVNISFCLCEGAVWHYKVHIGLLEEINVA
jgi:hypothetical protein